MPRFPRFRRERPINASTPAPAAKPEDEKAPAPKGAEDAPKAEAEKPKPETKAKAEAPAEKAKPEDKARAAEPKPEDKAKPKAEAKPKAHAAATAAPGPGGDGRGRRNAIALGLGGLVILVAILFGTGVLGSSDDSGESSTQLTQTTTEAPPPEEAVPSDANLGFPGAATRNTTRVPGSDPASDAAGVALAAFPSTGGARSPVAVSLVGEGDWQGGIAASALLAPPLGFPVLVSGADATDDALTALDPRGGALSDGTQAFAIGDADAPDDLRGRPVTGADPAKIAVAIAKLRTQLTGTDPEHIVVTTSDSPEFAMPAAGWAARSGDPVLFTGEKKLPPSTAAYLKANAKTPVYVLGPASVIPDAILGQISAAAGDKATRISAEDPVTNAIAFARFYDGDFGWNAADPGHGFVVARTDRPLDAAAAAPLSASGTWGPLLLTDNTDTLPGPLRGYLLDVKPGYRDDPTRALYNHVWIIGDEEAISVNQQASIDELAELAPINPPEPLAPTGATGKTGATGPTGSTTGDAGATGAGG